MSIYFVCPLFNNISGAKYSGVPIEYKKNLL